MRNLWISLVMVGCAVGDTELTPPEMPAVQHGAVAGRFASGMNVMDPGHGVLPDTDLDVTTVPRMWASMGDRLCVVEGRNGQIEEDVFVDDETPDGVVAIDADGEGFLVGLAGIVHVLDRRGGTQGTVVPGGPVAGGLLTQDGGVALVVDTVAGCALERDGSSVVFAEACRTHGDLEELDGTLFISTDVGIWATAGAGLEPFASGDQVSADPVTTAVWTGQTGDSLVTGHLGGSTIAVDLGAALVDLAARQGHVIALTDGAAPELLRLDATTGAILDRQPYVGALDRESMLLGDNGQSLVLTGRGHAQFYRVRTDAQMGL